MALYFTIGVCMYIECINIGRGGWKILHSMQKIVQLVVFHLFNALLYLLMVVRYLFQEEGRRVIRNFKWLKLQNSVPSETLFLQKLVVLDSKEVSNVSFPNGILCIKPNLCSVYGHIIQINNHIRINMRYKLSKKFHEVPTKLSHPKWN